MPVVKKVNPLSETIPDTPPSMDDATLEAIAIKIEECFARLNSLREPLLALEKLMGISQSLSERLEECEKALAGLELGKSPQLPDSVYEGLTPADVFKASLSGIFTAAFATFPSMLGSKPELQATHLRRVVDLAYRAMLVSTERMPKLSKVED